MADLRSDAGREFPAGAIAAGGLDVVARMARLWLGQIHADDRRSLGEPVALQHFDPELLVKSGRQIRRAASPRR